MTSASFSLFISLHFSSFSFFSYYTDTQKKSYRQNLHLICMAAHRSPLFFSAHSANTWAKTGICGWSFSSQSGEYFLRKCTGQQGFCAVVINADLRKSVLSVQTIKTLWKNKSSVVSFVVQALTNSLQTLRGVT